MNDSNAAATLVSVLHLGYGSHQKEHLSVTGCRKSIPEAPGKALLRFFFDGRLLIFPFSSKWRIRKNVVKSLAFKLVVRKSIAVLDKISVVALDEHVCLANRECLVIQFLTERHELGRRVKPVQVFLCHGKHTPCSTGGIIKCLSHIVAGKDIVVVIKEDIDHQLDDFTGCVVLSGVLIV